MNKKAKKSKKQTISDNILKFLFVYGKARVTDINRYANYVYETTSRGYTICSWLLSEELIVEASYQLSVSTRDGKKKIKDKVYAISSKGEEYISRIYPQLKSKGEYLMQGQALPEESDALDRDLTDKGIMLCFLAIGIAVFPDDKPSIDHLVYKGQRILPGYKDNLSDEECNLFMQNRVDNQTGEYICGGAYYSIREFTEYVKRSETIGDTFSGTRIRGIFVSSENCHLIFSSRRYSNKMVSVKYKSEKALLRAVKKAFSFTNVYRPIKELSTSSHIRMNRPSAIVFSDGKRLAYEMATGDVRGRRKKGKDMIEKVESLEKSYKFNSSNDSDSANYPTTYLTAGTDLYDDLYVMPLSLAGLSALEYLVTNSKENMIKDAQAVMDDIPDFNKTDNTFELYPYLNLKYRDNPSYPEYIPVINVMQLRWIREKGGVPFIITDKDLLDPIAHSIRLPAIYYDAATGEEFPEDEVYVYGKTGRVAGIERLQAVLEQNGLTISEPNEWHEIPKRMEMNHIELYNGIARGYIETEDVLPHIKTKHVKRKKQINKHHCISFLVDEESYREIQKISQEEGIKLSVYLRNLVRNDLKEKRMQKKDEKN